MQQLQTNLQQIGVVLELILQEQMEHLLEQDQNTIDIEAGCTTSVIAAAICANLTIGGYSDWFLPSKDELNQMYLNIGEGNALGLGNIGGFATDYYWSSTENDSNNAWYLLFFDGLQNNSNKVSSFGVRAVRVF